MKIPDKFHNTLEGKPFSHCKTCNGSLSDTEYLIEKAYRRFPENGAEELLFEIAICMDCAQKMRGDLSRESLENIEDFFRQRSIERQQQIHENGKVPDLLQECLLSGKKLEDMETYQVYAHCMGHQLSINRGFYMLSDDIIEEIQELLSEKTREELERFSDDNLGIPPELKHLFGKTDIIPV